MSQPTPGKPPGGTKAKPDAVSRRTFLRTSMYSTVGLFAATSAVGGLVMFWPAKVSGFGAIIKAGHVDDFDVNSVTRIREGRFYLVRLPEGFMALWWKCPHLGCTVPWNEPLGAFRCPCHGSTYIPNGQNVAGPTPRPMDMMEVSISADGQISVNTGNVTQRAAHQPEHVTPWPS